MGSRPREARRRLVWAVMASVLGGQRSPEGERKRVLAWWSLVVSRVSTKTVHLTVTIYSKGDSRFKARSYRKAFVHALEEHWTACLKE